jgi:hypothetical protein
MRCLRSKIAPNAGEKAKTLAAISASATNVRNGGINMLDKILTDIQIELRVARVSLSNIQALVEELDSRLAKMGAPGDRDCPDCHKEGHQLMHGFMRFFCEYCCKPYTAPAATRTLNLMEKPK